MEKLLTLILGKTKLQRNEWGYITVYITTRISAKVDKSTTLENCVNTPLSGVESDCNRVDIDGIIAELKAAVNNS